MKAFVITLIVIAALIIAVRILRGLRNAKDELDKAIDEAFCEVEIKEFE